MKTAHTMSIEQNVPLISDYNSFPRHFSACEFLLKLCVSEIDLQIHTLLVSIVKTQISSIADYYMVVNWLPLMRRTQMVSGLIS